MKRSFLEYNRTGIKIEVIIRDEDWGKLDSFKCDAKNWNKIASILKRKYGLSFSPEIPHEESVNHLEKERGINWFEKGEW